MNESLMELKIGQERQILPHEHAFMEFFYVIEGKMQCTSANQTFAVFKDDFFVVQKNQSHTFTASEKVLYMTIHVNHAIAGMYSEPELICCTAQMSRKETSENQKTRRLLRKIMNLYLSEDKMDELLLQSAYYELFYHLAYFYTEKVRVDVSISYKKGTPLAVTGFLRGNDKKIELAASCNLIAYFRGLVLIDSGWKSK